MCNWLPFERRESPNHGGLRSYDPDLIVIHYTASRDDESAISWLCNSESGVSAHFVIRRDGSVVQLVPLDRIAYHAGGSKWKGKGAINSRSVGVELCNAGYSAEPRDGYVESHGLWWEPYPEEQTSALVRLLVQLSRVHEKFLDVVGHDEIAPSRKQDPGPLFPWEMYRCGPGPWGKQGVGDV